MLAPAEVIGSVTNLLRGPDNMNHRSTVIPRRATCLMLLCGLSVPGLHQLAAAEPKNQTLTPLSQEEQDRLLNSRLDGDMHESFASGQGTTPR
jgi:hypothetical protein